MGKGGWEVAGSRACRLLVCGVSVGGWGVLEGSCPSPSHTPGPAADAELRHGSGTRPMNWGSGSWLVIRAGAVVATLSLTHQPEQVSSHPPELCAFLAASRPSCADSALSTAGRRGSPFPTQGPAASQGHRRPPGMHRPRPPASQQVRWPLPPCCPDRSGCGWRFCWLFSAQIARCFS